VFVCSQPLPQWILLWLRLCVSAPSAAAALCQNVCLDCSDPFVEDGIVSVNSCVHTHPLHCCSHSLTHTHTTRTNKFSCDLLPNTLMKVRNRESKSGILDMFQTNKHTKQTTNNSTHSQSRTQKKEKLLKTGRRIK
jgi:hypothetical protein